MKKKTKKAALKEPKITREKLVRTLTDSGLGTDILLMDGFEKAFVGISESYDGIARAVYDIENMAQILIDRDGCDYDDAMDYINFNCINTYVGTRTPIIIRTVPIL